MDMLMEALERFFRERATPAVIRRIEAGADGAGLWSEIEENGYLDLLVPEDAGGAGLPLHEAFGAFMLAGQHALPLPFVQTVMGRGWLHALGQPAPAGAIALAGPETRQGRDGSLEASGVAFGGAAEWVLAEFGGNWLLLPASAARVQGDGTRGGLVTDFHWASLPPEARAIQSSGPPGCSPAQLAAASLAPLLAGAARQALDMMLVHAAQRRQFGRPIGQFQAVQGQISVAAERVWAMRMAARLACHSTAAMPSARLAAIGKLRCSEAAAIVADVAHAVHGAIGITEEYDLQLYTRRLREWRRAAGTEAWWARQLGREVVQDGQTSALDFILACTR